MQKDAVRWARNRVRLSWQHNPGVPCLPGLVACNSDQWLQFHRELAGYFVCANAPCLCPARHIQDRGAGLGLGDGSLADYLPENDTI